MTYFKCQTVMFILVDINPIIVQNSSSVALLRFAAGKGHLSISYSVKHMKSKQFALTPLYLAAENGHLEACKLHILNAKAVIFIFVSKKLIIVHKSNKAFKIALLSTLLLKWSFIYSFSVKHLKSQQSALTQLHLAAENGHLEACKLHILNSKAVMLILVSKNLIYIA